MGGGHFSCRYHCSASISILIVFTVSNFPILAHFIHINGDWPNISDLKVRGMSTEGAAPCFQHCNHVLGVFGKNYLPLVRLGLTCHLVEIVYFMCSSSWIISYVWELRLQWILGKIISHQHVIYHVYHQLQGIM